MLHPNPVAENYQRCDFASQRDQLASQIVQRQFDANPTLKQRLSESSQQKCLADARYHCLYLSEAVATRSPILFDHYVAWCKTLLQGLNIPAQCLAEQLAIFATVLEQTQDSVDANLGVRYLRQVLRQFDELPNPAQQSHLDGRNAAFVQELLADLLACRRRQVVERVETLVSEGMAVTELYLEVLQPLLREVGRLWQLNQLSVAQEHYCTAAVQLLMGRMSVRVFSAERIGRSMLAACVGDELHEIGVRMVTDFFEMAGWDTHFLGANVPTAALVRLLDESHADLLCLSATLTSHLPMVSEIIATLQAEKALQHVKIVVGGYPFNLQPDLWQRIGAHGCARDAHEAVQLAAQLMVEG